MGLVLHNTNTTTDLVVACMERRIPMVRPSRIRMRKSSSETKLPVFREQQIAGETEII